MADAETITFTKVVRLEDADGKPIHVGSVLREIKDGDQGIVVRIARAGDTRRDPMECTGDITIQIIAGSYRVTNRYSQWRHVPRSEQTYQQRLKAWLLVPYEHDDDRGVSRDEALAIDGIMGLLPEDVVNWEFGPWPDSLTDALQFLIEHLEKLQK